MCCSVSCHELWALLPVASPRLPGCPLLMLPSALGCPLALRFEACISRANAFWELPFTSCFSSQPAFVAAADEGDCELVTSPGCKRLVGSCDTIGAAVLMAWDALACAVCSGNELEKVSDGCFCCAGKCCCCCCKQMQDKIVRAAKNSSTVRADIEKQCSTGMTSCQPTDGQGRGRAGQGRAGQGMLK